MDFTREPIIETVITPKEGCKLVVRSSKNSGQEEYFVDAVEVVCFGSALFYRTQERPKAFLVPVSDYEILEVREARMVLKNVGVERTIKIGGGKAHKEVAQEKVEAPMLAESAQADGSASTSEIKQDGRVDKKRDKRRHSRRRRGREDGAPEETEGTVTENAEAAPNGSAEKKESVSVPLPPPAILAPPPMLISETLARYKDNALFKNAFYTKEEQAVSGQEPSSEKEVESGHSEDILEALAMQDVSLEPSEYGTLGLENEPEVFEKQDVQEESHTKEKDLPF